MHFGSQLYSQPTEHREALSTVKRESPAIQACVAQEGVKVTSGSDPTNLMLTLNELLNESNRRRPGPKATQQKVLTRRSQEPNNQMVGRKRKHHQKDSEPREVRFSQAEQRQE